MGQDPSGIREEIEDTRARMGDTVEALGYKTDVKTRAREQVSGRMEAVKSKVTGTGSRANEATPGREDVKQSARQAAGMAQENPIGLALGSVAAGFLVGMLVPSTRVEDEKLGEISDQVKEKVKETAQEAGERGKQVAQQAAESAKETAQESGQQHAEELRQTAQEKAQETRQVTGSRATDRRAATGSPAGRGPATKEVRSTCKPQTTTRGPRPARRGPRPAQRSSPRLLRRCAAAQTTTTPPPSADLRAPATTMPGKVPNRSSLDRPATDTFPKHPPEPAMNSIRHTLQLLLDRRRRRRATLPWAELEAEAARQGCSPADIFFDRAGRGVGALPTGSSPLTRYRGQAGDSAAAARVHEQKAGRRARGTRPVCRHPSPGQEGTPSGAQHTA
jgi:gas vesicle protein